MRWFRCALTLCFVLGLAVAATSAALAQDKKEPTNKEKIVGIWEVTKSADAPVGALVEFTKDGKMKLTAKIDGKEITLEGTYTVDGDKINTIGPKGEKETAKIKKLTDTELAVEDQKGKVDEFKRKKK